LKIPRLKVKKQRTVGNSVLLAVNSPKFREVSNAFIRVMNETASIRQITLNQLFSVLKKKEKQNKLTIFFQVLVTRSKDRGWFAVSMRQLVLSQNCIFQLLEENKIIDFI
jgi:hypothetical protein